MHVQPAQYHIKTLKLIDRNLCKTISTYTRLCQNDQARRVLVLAAASHQKGELVLEPFETLVGLEQSFRYMLGNQHKIRSHHKFH